MGTSEQGSTDTLNLGGDDEDPKPRSTRSRKPRGGSIADAGKGDTRAAQATTPKQRPGTTAPNNTRARGMNRDDWVKIILDDNDNIPPTGQPFGLNGDTYIVRPGEEVLVPPGIISILNDAIVSVAVTDPNTMRIVGYRNRLRFPYHTV